MSYEKLRYQTLKWARIGKYVILQLPEEEPFTPIVTEYRGIEITQTSLNNFTFNYGGYAYAYLDFKTCASKIDSLLQPSCVIGRVGIYGGYGATQTVGEYPSDLDTYFFSPLNPFDFQIIQLEDPFKTVNSQLNQYFQITKSPYLRLYWGGSDVPVDSAKSKIRTMLGDLDLSMISGFVLGDDVVYSVNPVYYNELYDWMKQTYGKTVIQVHAPAEYMGRADGHEAWDTAWKADAWEFYSYWADYKRIKAFIDEYREKQGSKPLILLLYYAVGSDSAYSHTPDQARVAREYCLDAGIFSFDSTGKPGWWSQDPECVKRFNEAKALLA